MKPRSGIPSGELEAAVLAALWGLGSAQVRDIYRPKVWSDAPFAGPLWEALPEGALRHDPCAYLKEHEAGPSAMGGDSSRSGPA